MNTLYGYSFKLTNMSNLIAKISQKNNFYIINMIIVLALLSQFMPSTLVYADSLNIGENKPIAEPAVKPDKVVKSVITAYTSTSGQCDDDPFIAAWGDRVYDGMIAANWLPRGTKIKIPSLFGDKIFTVADRMNPRYGYGRLDIWLDTTRAEALKFGVQRAEVEIYYPDNELARNNPVIKTVAEK